ncbi:MAG: hypothetical protein HY900_25350 [Deltaproteobacteria bacterium]|nr:hypothetical protein [Deltaproteobacteria bacterium]
MTNSQVHATVGQIDGLSREVSDRMAQCGDSSAELSRITEGLQGLVSQFRTGQGKFEAVVRKVWSYRDVLEGKIAELQARGIDVFDERYQPVPGSDPPKFTTAYTAEFQRELRPLYDEALSELGAVFALCVDRNGYAAAHNSKYSRPLTGDHAADLVNSRDRRKFEDKTGLKAAQNRAPMMLQTYMRDTGEIMNDLSMPLRIGERHWGALRVGLEVGALLDG